MCLSGIETVYRTNDMQLNAFPIFILLLLGSCLLNSIWLSRQDCKVCAEISQSFHIKSELADKHSPTKVLFRVMLKAIEKLKACNISSIESAVDSVAMVIAKRIGKQSFSELEDNFSPESSITQIHFYLRWSMQGSRVECGNGVLLMLVLFK